MIKRLDKLLDSATQDNNKQAQQESLPTTGGSIMDMEEHRKTLLSEIEFKLIDALDAFMITNEGSFLEQAIEGCLSKIITSCRRVGIFLDKGRLRYRCLPMAFSEPEKEVELWDMDTTDMLIEHFIYNLNSYITEAEIKHLASCDEMEDIITAHISHNDIEKSVAKDVVNMYDTQNKETQQEHSILASSLRRIQKRLPDNVCLSLEGGTDVVEIFTNEGAFTTKIKNAEKVLNALYVLNNATEE